MHLGLCWCPWILRVLQKVTSSGFVCLKAILDKIRSNNVDGQSCRLWRDPRTVVSVVSSGVALGFWPWFLSPVARQLLARPGG